MNMVQIQKMCVNIYRDYIGMGRRQNEMDKSVLSLIMREYCQSVIDWEEVKWLWIQYLEKEILDIPEAIRKARVRIEQEVVTCVR